MRVKTATNGRNCAAPFDHPHDTGNGGIPTHTYESLGEKRARTTSASFGDAAGGNNRTPGKGNRRFPFNRVTNGGK